MMEREDRLTSIDGTLREILRWTRFANMGRLKEVLEAELDNDQKKLAYEGTDGKNGLKEVSEFSAAPISTISAWWPRWFQRGLVTESETRKGRMMRIVSLEDVGIEVPKRKASKAVAEEMSSQETVDQPRQDAPESGGG